MNDAERWARKFHDAYERMAPLYGYETREDTREFDQASKNGKLMMAVVTDVLSDFYEEHFADLKSAAARVICSRCNGMGATWHLCSQPLCGEFHKEDCPDCSPLRELGVKPAIHGDT